MKRHTFYRMGRWLLGTGSLLLLAWGMAPLFTSRIHVGCVVLMAAGVLGIGTAAALRPLRSLWLNIWRKKAGQAAVRSYLPVGTTEPASRPAARWWARERSSETNTACWCWWAVRTAIPPLSLPVRRKS